MIWSQWERAKCSERGNLPCGSTTARSGTHGWKTTFPACNYSPQNDPQELMGANAWWETLCVRECERGPGDLFLFFLMVFSILPMLKVLIKVKSSTLTLYTHDAVASLPFGVTELPSCLVYWICFEPGAAVTTFTAAFSFLSPNKAWFYLSQRV